MEMNAIYHENRSKFCDNDGLNKFVESYLNRFVRSNFISDYPSTSTPLCDLMPSTGKSIRDLEKVSVRYFNLETSLATISFRVSIVESED